MIDFSMFISYSLIIAMKINTCEIWVIFSGNRVCSEMLLSSKQSERN